MTVRKGRVSSVSPEKGAVSVYYPDSENVTGLLPVISNGIYKLPSINDEVIVLHYGTNNSEGVVLGTFWSSNSVPSENSGTVCFEFDPGVAYIKYDQSSGVMEVKAPTVNIVED